MICEKYLKVETLFKDVGQNILEWQKHKLARTVKSKLTFKLEADQKANDLLTTGLNKLFPNIPVISEEDLYHNTLRPDKYWLIDPIDGSASWYNGFNGFVTQGAYIERENPIFGIVNAPALDKTWIGEKNRGSFLNNKRLPLLAKNNRTKFVDNTPKPHGITYDIMSIIGSNNYLECGSIGLKSVLVADGTVDLFIKDVSVKDWDLAPAMVILNEVGGCLIRSSGNTYQLNGFFTKSNGFIVARDIDLAHKALQTFNLIKKGKKSGT